MDFFTPVLITGTRVALEPLTLRHLNDLAIAGADETIWRWLPTAHHQPGSMRSFIESALAAQRRTAMGIRDRPISPGSPWQNGIAERLIGTPRREFLDHVIFGEAHLRRILSAYVYYNQTRTHLALNKDCPLERPIQRFGSVAAIPVLAGLHHQ